MMIDKSRRAFLAGLSASGAASLFGSHAAVTDWSFFNELKRELKA